jgi:L-alanine-DL-glutamate epimerase-like enolase superfamily enzyme
MQTKLHQIEMVFQPLELTTAHPFGISYGTSDKSHNVLIELRYKDLVGLGEASPASYHSETPETVNAALSVLNRADVLGDDPFAIAEVSRRMDKVVAGNASAKAGIEMALHDLAGQIANLPVYKMLGLSKLAQPITDFTIGIAALDMIEVKTEQAIAAGYKILKVKQGTDFDREIIKRVRKVAKDLPLRVDANGGWTPKQAVEMSKFLAENNVQFIEQPLPKFAHVDDFRFVKEHSSIPIFADESICKAIDVARLSGAIDGVVVKLAKTGGLIEALRVIHTARAHGLQIMFGCMIESSIGVTAAVHLSSLCDYLDLDGALLLASDPYEGAVYEDGYLRLSDRPGLGVRKRNLV